MNKILLALAFIVSQSANGHELFFVENKGQVVDQFYTSRTDIDMFLRSDRMSMFIGNGAIHYQFRKPVRDNSYEPQKHKMGGAMEMYRMDVELVGANTGSAMVTSEKQAYYEQYYMPQFGPEGAVANAYQKITYKDVYPHIDWVFYIKDGTVEQDFIVNEGGDPSQIKIKYRGATSLSINDDGSFTANTPMGIIDEKAPVCFDAQNRAVRSSYQLDGNILSFNVGSYSGSITIDPTLVWERHDGGTGVDDVSGIDYDGQGNIYVTGENEGSNMATTGAYQGTFAGVKDAYIRKFTSANNLEWGTFFGGPDNDEPFDAVCSDDVVYIYGLSYSTTGIASPGAHQTVSMANLAYGPDAFLAKFSASGSRIWSTYYGGDKGEEWGEITCDNDGNIYMVGATSSTSGIATPGSHQPTLAAINFTRNGFLVKFDPDGVRQWGTYYGGDGGSFSDYVRGVACDASNNVYIVGGATSTTNISTPGSYQENYQGSGTNGLIAKFNGNGQRIWGTYYYPSTEIQSVTCDPQGNIFVAGNAYAQTDIATNGAFQIAYAGGSQGSNAGDCFISKLTSDCQRLWSTYLGGSDREYTEKISTDDLGHVYIVGGTQSLTDFPLVNAYQSTSGGTMWDGFFAKFSNYGLCMWSSYLGTQDADACHSVTIEDDHTFYVGSLSGSNSDVSLSAYLAKFSDNSAGVKKLEPYRIPLQVYPNPGYKNVMVKGVNEGDELRINNISGQLVYKRKLMKRDVESGIDIKELSPGIYFVSCKGETVKFIKQ